VSHSQKPARSFFLRSTLSIARELIGMHLVHRTAQGLRYRGRIVETEAYQGPQDLAAHSARGRTPRTQVMFGPPGHAYVYFIYGMWNCLNVVTARPGRPHAVLLRALEPLSDPGARTWGPGLLCKAFQISRELNGADLLGSTLWLEYPPARAPQARITRGTRIGVDYAGDWALKPWRYFDADSPYVSTAPARARAIVRASRGRIGK
jgi:DNA-3-methyladenine glycosylase